MKKAKKIQKSERSEIFILLHKGYSIRSIASVLGRSPNTVSYEIKNNSTNGIYDATKAQAKARLSLRSRRFQWTKINQNNELRAFIVSGLKQHWNPDEISAKMKRDRKPFFASKTAIYGWLRTSSGQRYCKYLYSKRYYQQKRGARKERAMILNRVNISKRPFGATNRTRFGHWEKDSVCSGKTGKGTLAVMQERKSRYIEVQKTFGFSPSEHNEVMFKMMKDKKVLSLTYDNGIENKKHSLLGVPSFFCDPYSSWQKGGIENANKMIRRYLPKGTSLSEVPQEYINHIVSTINNKPRKILNYRSSLEVARENGVLLGCPNSGVN